MRQVQIFHIGYHTNYTYEVSGIQNVSDEDFSLLKNVIGLNLQNSAYGHFRLIEILPVPTIQGLIDQEKDRVTRFKEFLEEEAIKELTKRREKDKFSFSEPV